MEIIARNTNELQPLVYRQLARHGVIENSRNGKVLRFREPLLIKLFCPWERVNACPVRDANPFFHIVEAAAMLGNHNSVELLEFFASNMSLYTDDGKTYNAFYGTRLRSHWGDQLNTVIRNLNNNPDSRQEVALIWDPSDLTKLTKDKACNLLLLFTINQRTKALEMSSVNRSNDLIFGGVSGANIVHLSFFQEYVAFALGYSMGPWWHFSNNAHVYVDNPKWEKVKDLDVPDPYAGSKFHQPFVPLFLHPADREAFDAQLSSFLFEASSLSLITTPETALPFIQDLRIIFNVWVAHKRKDLAPSYLIKHLSKVRAEDWRLACQAWIARRYQQTNLPR